jgi:glutamyl-Q tRNA(Asp) synthetase
MKQSAYRGRFAPSPTGPLHFGSLVAAVGSFLDARRQRGAWLVRMEDLDPPRVVAGAADDILRTLDAFGLHWDEAVMYQSRRHAAYAEALDALRRMDAVYPCSCSRREIADSALAGVDGPIYPGTCRPGLPVGKAARAWRVKVNGAEVAFADRVQGAVQCRLALEVGDYIVRRADALYAYQLAVVVDDAEQRVTDVVRGADLLGSTARQIHLQQLLRLPSLRYAHLPVAINGQGEKLSKQTGAAALDPRQAVPLLCDALAFLGQCPPSALRTGNLSAVWEWATTHWELKRVPPTADAPSNLAQ